MTQRAKSGGKKGFYEVEAPMTAVKISLYGNSEEELDGRVVTLDLTKSLRGKSIELRMKVKNEEGKLRALPISANLAGIYIRRAMRRGIDYVEDSFESFCKDAVVIVKPFLITRKKVSRRVRKVLRENAQKYLKAYMKIRSLKELFSDLMANKIQKGMAIKLKKNYPLALCEIRFFEFKREKTAEEIAKEKEEEREETKEEVLEEVVVEEKEGLESDGKIKEDNNLESESEEIVREKDKDE